MSDMISRDAVLAEIAKEGLHILDAAIRAIPAADARAEALKEAIATVQARIKTQGDPSIALGAAWAVTLIAAMMEKQPQADDQREGGE